MEGTAGVLGIVAFFQRSERDEMSDIQYVDGIPFKNPDFEDEAKENNPEGLDLRVETARWIKENLEVAELFIRYCKEMATRGKRFGIGLVAERVRWHVIFERGDEKYKINNNYRAYIARWVIAREPTIEPLLTFRSTRY